MMGNPYHRKDSQIVCRACGAHVATWARDVFGGENLTAMMFRQDEGQAPFYNGDPMNCRECGEPYSWIMRESTADAC